MKAAKASVQCVLLLVSLLLAYGNEWAPYYVRLFAGSSLNVLGPIDQWRVDCDLPPSEGMSCTDRYVIPESMFRGDQADDIAFGLGIIISATEIRCTNRDSNNISFGRHSGAATVMELLKTYQVIDLRELKCHGDLDVTAWSPGMYQRKGFLGSPVSVGAIEHVRLAKRLTEFFSTYLYFLLSLVLIAVWAISTRVVSRLLEDVKEASIFDSYLYAWIGFSLIKSGLAEMMFPVLSRYLLVARLSNFFALLAYFGPILHIVVNCPVYPRWVVRPVKWATSARLRGASPLHGFFFLFCISPFFGSLYGPLYFIALGLAVGQLMMARDLSLASYTLVFAIDVAKLFNVPFAPYGNLSMIYVSLVSGLQFANQVARGRSLVDTLTWARSLISRQADIGDASSMLAEFASRLKLGQVTLITPKENGTCGITIQRSEESSWVRDSLYRQAVPPVFAHVLSTREPLWNVEEESKFAQNLRRGEKSVYQYRKRHFSVVPIVKQGIPIGALAFTNYSDELFGDDLKRLELELSLQILLPTIASKIEQSAAHQTSSWANQCAKIRSELDKLMSHDLQNYCDVISGALECSVIIGAVDPLSRKVHIRAIAGCLKGAEAIYHREQLYAVQGNETGPMPMAVNRRMCVTIPDVAWLKGVLHPVTQNIFEENQTKSFAAVPIFLSSGNSDLADDKAVWGVMWFESQQLGAFLPHQETGLVALAGAIESCISRSNFTQKAERALMGLVRRDIAEKLMNEAPVREEEQGFLLVADLRGSTVLAREFGTSAWTTFVDRVKPEVEVLSKSYGFELQVVIWDAFYFTKASEIESYPIQEMVAFSEKLNQTFLRCHGLCFPSSFLPQDRCVARFCVEYGDISRDIQNNTWTIVGGTMAAVSKLEGACKTLKGWFFYSDVIHAAQKHRRAELLTTVVPGTGHRVVRFNMPPKVLTADGSETDIPEAA